MIRIELDPTMREHVRKSVIALSRRIGEAKTMDWIRENMHVKTGHIYDCNDVQAFQVMLWEMDEVTAMTLTLKQAVAAAREGTAVSADGGSASPPSQPGDLIQTGMFE